MATMAGEVLTGDADMLATMMGGAVRDALGLTSADLEIASRIAKLALDRDVPADAFRTYSAILICEPANFEALIGLATCALRLDLFDVALHAASAAVALAPRDARGYLLSGRACLGLGHPAEAREDLADAVRLGVTARAAGVVEEARRLLAVAGAA